MFLPFLSQRAAVSTLAINCLRSSDSLFALASPPALAEHTPPNFSGRNSTISLVAILATVTAHPITSAVRLSPFGPLALGYTACLLACSLIVYHRLTRCRGVPQQVKKHNARLVLAVLIPQKIKTVFLIEPDDFLVIVCIHSEKTASCPVVLKKQVFRHSQKVCTDTMPHIPSVHSQPAYFHGGKSKIISLGVWDVFPKVFPEVPLFPLSLFGLNVDAVI